VTLATRPRRTSLTVASSAFVAEHRARAEALGGDLAELVQDPEAFLATLRSGLIALADEEYRAGTAFVAPGIGPTFGVRNPLQSAVRSGLRRRLRSIPPSVLLMLADRLSREEPGEIRWLSMWLAGRALAADPERAWQLLRRHARAASEWISVDTLASYFGQGILNEQYRWAEIEQLVFSPSRWERRLVGSTLATLPFIDRSRAPGHGRDPEVARRGLAIIGDLIGDAEPDVQKALSWALRSLSLVDVDAVATFCERETGMAVEADDGYRAWVIRDALPKLPPELAAELRGRLGGIRRRPGGAPTSRGAAAAAAFLGGAGLPAAADLPEPPL
jgi:3-methyladenine DNA glycosylase AlkD